MKSSRQEKILELINNNDIYTQEELISLLKNEGFDVTQATISRDIRELRLIKNTADGGKYKSDIKIEGNLKENLFNLIVTYVLSVETAMNLVVIKTNAGMAQAVCANIDSMDNSDIIGTVAGDDTIFLATKNIDMAENVAGLFKDLLSGR